MAAQKVIIDFETFSECDLTKHGTYIYAQHPSTKLLCMGYKIDDNPGSLWLPGDDTEKHQPLIDAFENGAKFYAMNATFDYKMWLEVGPKHDTELFSPLPLNQVIDIKALCARFRLPQNLKTAAIALKCNTEKMEVGKRLIRVCCTPGYTPTEQDYKDLYTYCEADVQVAYEILKALPADHLTPKEQELWELTYKMNERGVPVDIEAVHSVIDYLSGYMATMVESLPDLTGGKITAPTQTQRIKQFCIDNGVELPDTQAETVNEFLKSDVLPENVRAVLEIRQLTGLSSLAKYTTLINLYNNGAVQGIYNYHGAGTGRWAGQGFQIHNLPREKKKRPDIWVERFKKKSIMKRPAVGAKALIRSMLCAPDGYKFIVSDYSSIEDRVNMWVNDEHDVLTKIRNNVCTYKDMASSIYNIPIEQVTKEQRFMGKQTRLGCGYQMGAKRFKDNVKKQADVVITLATAERLVNAYRSKHVNVVKGWRKGSLAAMAAIRKPWLTYKALKCEFRCATAKNGYKWLRVTLPSGRALMYYEPKVEEGKYGPVATYAGLNSKTFQFTRLELTPGLITENVVQAIARDLLADATLRIERHMPEVELCLSVHDELGGLIADSDVDENTMKRFDNMLCERAEWAKDIPVSAEGYIAQRYRKD